MIPFVAGAGFVVGAVWAARSYGLAFDSQYLFPYGDAVLRYLVGSGPWPLTRQAQTFELYGPLALLGAAMTSTLLHDTLGLTNPLFGHHVFILVCAGALVGVTAQLASDLFGPRAAVLAALVLATAPRFFAEAQNNVVDVPATLAWTASLAGIARAVRRRTIRPLVGAALAFGALGAIRLPSLPFLPCVAVLWLVIDGEARDRLRRACSGRWWAVAGVCLVGVISVLLFRPLVWMAPRLEFWSVFEAVFVPRPGMSRGVVDVFYGGNVRHGGPRSYHLVMLAVTTPLPVLVAAAGGFVAAWRRQRSAACLLASWLGVAVGRHAVMGLGNYDGIRHVLDALPALALLAAVGSEAAIEAVSHLRPGWAFTARSLGTLVLVAPGVIGIWRLHPYAVTYYNELAGGVRGASRWFETEYSGAAYREALDWAAAHLGKQDRIWLTRDYDRPLVQLEAHYLGHELPLWDGRLTNDVADQGRVFTMQILRPGPFEQSPARLDLPSLPIVHEIRRDGVPLLRVREVPPRLLRPAAVTRDAGSSP